MNPATLFIWTVVLATISATQKSLSMIPFKADIELGTDMKLLCKAASGKEAVFLWYKPNGEEIDDSAEEKFEVQRIDETNSALNIKSVEITDSGVYKCIATFDETGEEVIVKAEINIIQKVTLKDVKVYYEFREGDDATIFCHVKGIPTPVVTWYHNSQVINPRGRLLIQQDSLTIRNVVRSDGGTYTCEGKITDRQEVAQKDISVVITATPLVRFSNSIENVTAEEPAPPLICLVTGYPQPTVMWMRNGIILDTDSGKYTFNTDKTELKLTSVEKSDEGEYTCKAKNKLGEAQKTLKLHVFVKPVVTMNKDVLKVVERQKVDIPCEVKGDPVPTIQWLKNTTEVGKADPMSTSHMNFTYQGGESILTIWNVQHTDADQYACVATSMLGQDSHNVIMEVEFVPKMETPENQTLYTWVGNPVNVTILFLSNPEATVSLHHNGKEIGVQTKSEGQHYKVYIEVTPNSEEDFGSYELIAKNQLGSSPILFTVKEAATPEAPLNVTVKAHATTLNVNFDPPLADGGAPVIQYKLEWKKKEEKEWESKMVARNEDTFITELDTFTDYEVRVTAINGKGEGVPSKPTEAKTLSRREPDRPRLSGSIQPEDNSVHINLEQIETGGSPIFQYEVQYKLGNETIWQTLKSNATTVQLKDLKWGSKYTVEVRAENKFGHSAPAVYNFTIPSESLSTPSVQQVSRKQGVGTGGIVGIIMVIFLVLLIVVDVSCYYSNRCGMLMCIAVNLLGKRRSEAKGLDVEEGDLPVVKMTETDERTKSTSVLYRAA
ncbi:neural cell adhesion molecule 1 isoform X2 [Latimeria chalumnae]|uniref:neural cell adhesion molecule 1 isoform X2 n=1 Tax=Latimeria chalumnae TaxID=7897 RepID=UPI00313D74B3